MKYVSHCVSGAYNSAQQSEGPKMSANHTEDEEDVTT